MRQKFRKLRSITKGHALALLIAVLALKEEGETVADICHFFQLLTNVGRSAKPVVSAGTQCTTEDLFPTVEDDLAFVTPVDGGWQTDRSSGCRKAVALG